MKLANWHSVIRYFVPYEPSDHRGGGFFEPFPARDNFRFAGER